MKDSYIGLMVEDSSALLTGLLGILKSGNCVVPINPKFPPDRIRFIVEDCRIRTIL
ncbi:MAG: AMP-binding protein, partial [Candidatus Aminicenantes bacterium]|nr:AMP-binding protein [Candidatus Aminicenantes bacterium]